MSRVLFLCVRNAGRSQMAEALFLQASDGRHEARSAGTAPADRVHPEVVDVTRELAVDLSRRIPRRLDRADAEWADVVVTMGCGDACPYVEGTRYLEWELPDPDGLPLAQVRAIRGEISRLTSDLAATLDEP